MSEDAFCRRFYLNSIENLYPLVKMNFDLTKKKVAQLTEKSQYKNMINMTEIPRIRTKIGNIEPGKARRIGSQT